MDVRWAMLCYRIPREPSTPRIAVWRKLRRLGVAQLGDGLVALPLNVRNRERLEWVAEDVEEAGGTATVWLASPASRRQEQAIIEELVAARAEEYRQITAEADSEAVVAVSAAARRRAVRRLRQALRRVRRRDYFPPPEHSVARAAVERLAATLTEQSRPPSGVS